MGRKRNKHRKANKPKNQQQLLQQQEKKERKRARNVKKPPLTQVHGRKSHDWDQHDADALYEHAQRLARRKRLVDEDKIAFLSKAVEVIEAITERTPDL